ncbi:MFS transporter [Adlercreutzia murintestinalis]|uniref:MFS transporter n=1 Tax=Adlercreutzia murintestinalis TaxID=2941325 RepID=UPI00203FE448|nr:MFS transporter [Adlercreutzia murintestinalis]
MSMTENAIHLGIASDPIQKTPRYAWVILAVTYLASICAPLGQFKITAIAGEIIGTYGLGYAEFGMLMTCLAIIGAILAFPAAFICRRIGLRATCAIALGCIIAGGLVEVATNSVVLLYLGRFAEGVGLGLIGVAAPTIISLWFPNKTRGLALGAWCTWVPMAITIDFNVAPALAATFGWQSVFYGVVAVTIVALVLFVALYRVPVGQSSIPNYGVEGSFRDCFTYLKNRYIWILGLTFLVFNFIQGGVVNTYYPTYLGSVGFDMATAGFMTSVITLIGFIMNPLSGAWSDRLSINRKYILVTLFAVTSIIGFLVGFPSEASGLGLAGIWAFIVLMGFSAAFGGGGSRPLAPTILSSSAMAATLGMAVMQFTQCFGQMLAPVYGACLDAGLGWMGSAWATVIPLSVIALVLSFFIKPGGKASGHD